MKDTNMYPQLSLPPLLKGKPRGTLTLQFTHFSALPNESRSINNSKEQPSIVKILWWGQSVPEQLKIPSEKQASYITYDVLTSLKNFRTYLRDASRIFFEIGTENNQRVGFAVLNKLERILDEENPPDAKQLDVFNDDGDIVGYIFCRIFYESLTDPKRNNSGRPVFKIPPKMKVVGTSAKKIIKSRIKERENTGVKKTFEMSSSTSGPDNYFPDIEAAQMEHKRLKKEEGDENKGLLPSWNLSTSRLHFISAISQVCIEIRSLEFSSEVASLLPLTSTNNPPNKVTLKSRGMSAKKSMSSTTSLDQEKQSFFVSFSLPPSTLTNNFCSRKIRNNREVVFNETFTHPVKFKPDVLDTWWTSDLRFKILSRKLKQRESTLIGEASIGLKYLLTDLDNSKGRPLKLPIYTGQVFFAEHKLKSEILGDLHISFSFTTTSPPVTDFVKPVGRPVSPQKAEREFERPAQEKEAVSILKKKMPKQLPSVPDDRRSQKREWDEVKKISKFGNIYCSLKIPEGRNFTLDSKKPCNLFVSSRLFTGDEVKSQVCWNTTRPAFNLSHMVPFEIDEEFLRRCRDNYLVVEVWNLVNESKDVIGVAMVSLQQLFLSYRDDNRIETSLSTRAPVVVLDDWIQVIDLVDGNEVGQIKVVLTTGTNEQLFNFNPRPPTTLGSWIGDMASKEEEEENHIYDSVHEDTNSASEESHKDSSSLSSEDIKVDVSKNGKQKEEEEEAFIHDQQPGKVHFISAAGATTRSSNVEEKSHHAKSVKLRVSVSEGRNLPKVFKNCSEHDDEKVKPSSFVTFTCTDRGLVHSRVELNTTNPVWNFKDQLISMEESNFLNPRSYLIAKVWHHVSDWKHRRTQIDLEHDQVIGFVAVDLSPLLCGLPGLCGWYNVTDFAGRCRGQVKVEVELILERGDFKKRDLENLRRRDSELFKPNLCPSPFRDSFQYSGPNYQEDAVSEVENEATENQFSNDESSRYETEVKLLADASYCPPLPNADDLGDTRSFLAMKLRELDNITQNLKGVLKDEPVAPRVPGVQQQQQLERSCFSTFSNPSFDEIRRRIEENLAKLKDNGTRNRSPGGLHQNDEIVQNMDLTLHDFSSIQIVDNSDDTNAGESFGEPDNRRSALEDLQSIDWNRVQSRMHPEGENPEDEALMSKKND